MSSTASDCTKKPFYHTPPCEVTKETPDGYLRDFKNCSTYQKWSDVLSGFFEKAIHGDNIEETGYYGAGTYVKHPQYYNAEFYPTNDNAKATRRIAWSAFPRRILEQNNYDLRKSFEEADNLVAFNKSHWYDPSTVEISPLPASSLIRVQDEYCEWRVIRDEKTNKITDVILTAEGPEYYGFNFSQEPESILALYKKLQPENADKIKMEDLIYTDHKLYNIDNNRWFNMYNPLNKWNTTHGIMHLCCPPNSLSAEVGLGGQACVRRKGPRGGCPKGGITTTGGGLPPTIEKPIITPVSTKVSINNETTDDKEIRKVESTVVNDIPAKKDDVEVVVTNPLQLLLYGQTGGATRNSDPSITAKVNNLAKAGLRVTIRNPVGLFLEKPDIRGWMKPNGEPVTEEDNYVRLIRGDEERGLRYHISIPKDNNPEGWTLSDLTVGGIKVEYGSQFIYQSVTVFLDGVACTDFPYGAQPAVASEAIMNGRRQIEQEDAILEQAKSILKQRGKAGVFV